jgi:small subunit ribosomal protein S13
MARIAGVELIEERRADVGLTAIYGIGRKLSGQILFQAKIDPARRIKELTSEELTRLQKEVEKYPVEGALRQKVSGDIKRLKSINSYRGSRHVHSLPSRGQRTRSNARTRRGKRKTVGAIKKSDVAKTDTTVSKA